MTPYNTGKVQIGRSYVPKQCWKESGDEYRIQSALLNVRSDSSFWFVVIYTITATTLFTLAYIIVGQS